MAEASGGSEKAFFTNVDASETFYVQFNPKQLKMAEKASWTDSGEHEAYRPKLTYEKGQPSTLEMDLIFDTTDTMEDCYEKYVKKLRAFLATTYEGQDEEKNQIKRPPHMLFTWNSFVFECVVTDVSTTFLMFKADGTPLRTQVNVKLKEREREDPAGSGNDAVTLSAMGSMFSGSASKASTYTVKDGDTLSAVAAATGADMRDIAAANGVSDPMNLSAGATFVIPGDPGLAGVLGAQALSSPSSNWAGDTAAIDDFASAIGASGAPTTELDSAFDDLNELGVMVTSSADEAVGAVTSTAREAAGAASQTAEQAQSAVNEVASHAARAGGRP